MDEFQSCTGPPLGARLARSDLCHMVQQDTKAYPQTLLAASYPSILLPAHHRRTHR